MIYVLLTSEFPWQRNVAITFSTCLCISRYQDFFFRFIIFQFLIRRGRWIKTPKIYLYRVSLDPWGATKEAFQGVLATNDIAPKLQKM